MKNTVWFCVRCGGEMSSYQKWGLCDECKKKVEDNSKFQRLGELSGDSQKSICDEHGASSIEESFVINNWGRPKSEDTYTCDRCGCDTDGKSGIRCQGCQDQVESEREEEEREQEKLKRKLGF